MYLNTQFKSVLILIIFILSSCGPTDKSKEADSRDETGFQDLIRVSSTQFDENNMVLGSLETRDFREKIQVSGMIDVPPQNKAVVSVPLGGYVTHTSLLVGDQVKQGQSLVTLENPEYISLQQKYLETKEKLGYLKAEFERHQKLYEENISSQKNFLKSESDYKTARATYRGLQQQLRLLHISPEAVEAGNLTSNIQIYSPIKGSVSKMNITKGAYISPATEIMEIIDIDHIHLELVVFEKDINKVKEGQAIEFNIPEASEKTFNGEVYRVGSSIDEHRRIIVHGHIDEGTEFSFIKGMFVTGQIIADTERFSSLAETAVVESENRYYVLLLRAEKDGDYLFEAREVEVYATEADFVAVGPEGELQKDAQYLVKGAFSLIGSN